jgi:hypothetical protein
MRVTPGLARRFDTTPRSGGADTGVDDLQGRWRVRKLLAAMACTALFVGIGASAAFAGEVTGNGKPTAIASHVANSLCAFNGLNDLNPEQGQTTLRVQTPRDGEPGDAAFGLEVEPGLILSCNPNGPVGS